MTFSPSPAPPRAGRAGDRDRPAPVRRPVQAVPGAGPGASGRRAGRQDIIMTIAAQAVGEEPARARTHASLPAGPAWKTGTPAGSSACRLPVGLPGAGG